ncbi:DNA-directed DNA polymerase [Coemansia sp. RSA 1365]|nr:DNA-directed DNA polymerase [Coemansia sp. RSA 1365]
MPTTLDFYWDLASLDEGKRIAAASQLIATLCDFQAKMPETNEVATTEEALERICAGDVSYAVKRLIKGLASSRDGARQGYSVALAELLARVECISVKVVLDLLWKNTEATKSMSGQEQRDMRFGRIFGMMSVVQSGILTRKSTTAVELRKMTMELAAIGAKKSYLREIAYATLTAMVPLVSKLSFRDEAVEMMVSVALEKGAVETPDELQLAMKMRYVFPGYDWGAALPQWQGKHMLSAKNVTRLKAILCETSAEKPELFSSWHPQLHGVWNEIFDLYFNKHRAYEVETLRPIEFEALWDAVVEGGLFAPGASQFRRYWGFLVLERLLPYLSEETVPATMTPNVVRALSDNVSAAGKTALAKAGMRAAERLTEICEGSTKVGLAVLTHLLNQKNTIPAASAGKTNLRTMMASRIVVRLDSDAISGYVDYLQEVFLAPRRARSTTGVAGPATAINVSDKSLERQRMWAIDQMIRVARFGQLPTSDELTARVVRFVVAQAALVTNNNGASSSLAELATVAHPVLSQTARDYCATALMSLVGELTRQAAGAGATAERGPAWATMALTALLEGAAHKGVHVMLRGFIETRAVLGQMAKVLRAMGEYSTTLETPGDAQRVRALEQLLGNLSVMTAFSNDPQARAEFAEALPELHECYTRMQAELGIAKRRTRKSRSVKVKDDGDEEPRPVEVLTDMLIGFLAKESNVLRRLCEQAFVPFAGVMTAEAMESIVGVLQAHEGGADGAVSTEMDVDAMDVDDDEDVEAGQMEGVDEEGVDEELRRRIQEALGEEAAEVSGSESEEEFDDEQMTVFDDKLAEIFRQRKQQKTAARDLKISLANFKLRVLDLADVFLTRQPESPLVMQLLPAIVDLARATQRDTRNRAVHDRAAAILGARRARFPTGFDCDKAAELLASIHERARRAADRNEARVLGNVAAFVSRALLDVDSTTEPRVRELYTASVRDFMTRKASQIHVDFFRAGMEKLLPAQLPLFWHVAVDALAHYAHPRQAVNVYRQVQAYALADTVVSTASRVAELPGAAALAERLLVELRAALLATVEFAVSDENTAAAAGKLLLDSQRLREILRCALQLIRRLAKNDTFTAATTRALKSDAAWTAAVKALAASPRFSSPVIKKNCEALADLQRLVATSAASKTSKS